jgi:hypothetical protein
MSNNVAGPAANLQIVTHATSHMTEAIVHILEVCYSILLRTREKVEKYLGVLFQSYYFFSNDTNICFLQETLLGIYRRLIS